MSSSANLYLIRHADTVFPVNDVGQRLIYAASAHLSELGRAQMRSLGLKLQMERISLDIIFSSPYNRAAESAEILRERIGGTLQIREQLKDAHTPGWIGRSMDDLAKIGGDHYQSLLTEDQETLSGLVRRARIALEEVLKGRISQSIGVVSHGDLISALGWVMDREDEPDSYADMKNYFYLEKAQACRCKIDERAKRVGEREFITVEEVEESIESWRNPGRRK